MAPWDVASTYAESLAFAWGLMDLVKLTLYTVVSPPFLAGCHIETGARASKIRKLLHAIFNVLAQLM